MIQKLSRIYYGWWIVAILVFISAYVGGVVVFSFTAIFQPIAREFGWSYTQVSIAASIRGLEMSFVSPMIGWLYDRLGPRKLLFMGTVVASCGLLLLGLVNSLVMFYAICIFMAIAISACCNIVPWSMAGNWFRKKLTMATGIASCGPALGGLFVGIVSSVIDAFDWRIAMLIFGGVALVLLVPLSLLVRKKTARDYYPEDDDVSLQQQTAASTAPVTGADLGVKEALKNRAIWHIAFAMMTQLFVVNTIIVHVMPYLSTVGISRTTASLAASAMPLLSILGRLSFGWFGDRHNKKMVIAFGLACLVLGNLLFNFVSVSTMWLMIPFLIFFGLGYGGLVPLLPAIIREYFGARNLGTLIGVTAGVTSLGSIISAPIAGWIYDTTGSYQMAWLSFMGVAVLGIISILTTPVPKANKG